MECKDIKQILSEYIDSALDEDRKNLVEGHLSTCQKCSEELESLRTYVRVLNSLEGVKAPDNFLEKVRERLELCQGFKRIVHKLFIPVRIKIPLELAGAAATAIVVIYIYNTVQPMSKMAVAPSLVTGRQKIDWEERKRPAELAFKEEKPAPLISIPEDLSGSAVKKESEKSIEVALLIKLDEYKKKGRAVGTFEYDKLAQKTLEEQEKKLAEVPLSGAEAKVKAVEHSDVRTSGELARESEAPYDRAEGIVKESKSREFKTADKLELASEEIEKLKKEEVTEVKEMAAASRLKAKAPMGGGMAEVPIPEGKVIEKRDELWLQYSNEIVSGVKNLIELVQGKVISVEYEKDTNLLQFLNAEIPAWNYGLFLEKLGQFGQVQEPLPSITTEANEPIQVRIGIIVSK